MLLTPSKHKINPPKKFQTLFFSHILTKWKKSNQPNVANLITLELITKLISLVFPKFCVQSDIFVWDLSKKKKGLISSNTM